MIHELNVPASSHPYHSKLEAALVAGLAALDEVILLDSGTSQAALDLPGYRLHQLKGDRKGQWAVWVFRELADRIRIRGPRRRGRRSRGLSLKDAGHDDVRSAASG
jgi:plasmid maintenance system killer protein